MCCHEIKSCPRCGAAFECKSGTVNLCHCYHVSLTVEQQAYLEEKYADCLCPGCLAAIGAEFELYCARYIFPGGRG